MHNTMVPKIALGLSFLLAGILASPPAGAQQPASQTLPTTVSGLLTQTSTSLIGPTQPSCTDPAVPCPPGSSAVLQPMSPPTSTASPFLDAFGTPIGGCATCIQDLQNPGGPNCTFSEWDSAPPAGNPTAPQLMISKFQPPDACYQLVQAEIRLRATLCGVLRVENRDPINQCFNTFTLGPFSVNLMPAPGQGLDFLNTVITNPVFQEFLTEGPFNLGPYDGSTDFGGTSGISRGVGPLTADRCYRITDPAQLAAFIDTGVGSSTLFFNHNALDQSSSTGCAPQTFKSDPFAGVEIEVTYRYCLTSPPATAPDSARVCAGGSVDINVLANDSDPEGNLDCGSLAVNIPPANGTAVVMGCSGTGAACAGCFIRYTPNPGYTGPDNFSYSVSDASGLECSSKGQVTVDVCATTANDDTGFRVCRGAGAISIPVTLNDTTSCGALSCASITITSPPAQGTAVPNGCNINYTPPAGFTGVVTFGYSICNDTARACCDEATVTVEVCATTANDDTGFRVCRGGSPISIPVTVNDTTTCGTLDCRSITVTSPPAQGSVVRNGCNLVYTPPTSAFTGIVTFEYSICNDSGPACCDTATVSVEVCATNANDDTGFRVCVGGAPLTIPVTVNDSTTCGTLDCTSITITNPPAQGTAVRNGCNIVYTPPASGFTGVVTFGYSICNNTSPACCDTATVSVEVCATNAVDDTGFRVCRGGGPLSIPVTANDTTSCGALDCRSITVTSPPAQGSVVRNGCNLVYTPPTSAFTGVVTFQYSICNDTNPACCDTATVSVEVCATTANDDTGFRVCEGGAPITIPVTVNDSTTCGALDCTSITITSPPAQGSAVRQGCNIVYTPPASFTGQVTFGYSICNNTSPACCDEATVTVEVCSTTARNDGRLRVCRGEALSIPVTANDETSCGALDCSSITIVTPPQHGTAVRSGCTVTYTSTDPTFTGVDTFEYSICNDTNPACCDTATVSVEVCATTANDDTGFRVCQGAGALSIPVTVNDTTSCGTLSCASITITSPPAQGTAVPNGCNINYTPPAGFTGMVTFNYSICNNTSPACCDEATVSVEVCATTANDDTGFRVCRGGAPISIPVTVNDSTTCGALDCTSITITSPPAQGSAVRNGCNIVYTPPGGRFTGVVTFQYSICNNLSPVACCDTATVSVEVCATDAVNDTGFRVCAGDGPLSIPVTLNDTTSCGALDCSSIVITTAPTQGTATPNGCSINYTPPADFAGVVTFGYRICNDTDPACCDEAQVTVEVCRTIARDDGRQRVCVGEQISIPVTANDSTSCGTLDCSSIVIVTQPLHGTVTANGCNVSYTSTDPVFTGIDTFEYSICNNTSPACCDTATVSVEVCATNAVDDTGFDVCEGGGPISIPVTLNDTTSCGALACSSITVTTPPAQGSAVPNGCGIDYTPPTNFVGTVTFGYRICNDTTPACCDEATVTVEVCRVVALPDAGVICVGDFIEIPVLNNDSSTCGALDCTSIAIVTQPLHGTAVRSGCNVIYTSTNLGFSGVDTFEYRVCDDVGCCGTALVSIEIKPLPIALDDTATKPFGSLAPIDIPVLDNDTGGGAGCLLVPDSVAVTTPAMYGTVVANPDGTLTYTPTATIPADTVDTFCYEVFNTCGCRAEACVQVEELPPACPTRNRRQPGSLLLFPEFDNRGENLTYITITNTNCNMQNGAIDVHIFYVDDQTCLKNDFTISLTPCDTWTAITSAHNPNFQRGFVYAFAKSRTTGKAVSFNWLIGNEIVIDGIDVLDYGINAVVFKAVPPQGQNTDLDNDNIRDFDGVEYEEAPERLLIPRFLGQDPPAQGTNHSELILIALSGGRAFTTVVDFLIYNDNEEVFSAAYTIDCWDKPRLTDISGAFLETFLQSTLHDPGEIVGDPTRESGWFNVNGQLANSTVETIVDPAIYAVLVERDAPWSAADLPWEECIQTNADLCPMSIFGDGPDYVAGDNE